MAADNPEDGSDSGADGPGVDEQTGDTSDVRERLGQGTDRAVEGFDRGVVDLLSWVLDTETRARIYVHLRTAPDSTSEEVASGTGLYPSTVREALAELHEEGHVRRTKRQSDGAGNNPYEYSAIPPSELVSELVEDVQDQLNTVFNLDRVLDGGRGDDSEPVTITVREAETDENHDDERDELDDDTDGADGEHGESDNGFDDGWDGSDAGEDADDE
jgi:predicted transcriptional regulator